VDDSKQAEPVVRYSALVRGPSSTFPRGGLWVFGFWYVVIYVVLWLEDGHQLWFRLVVLVALAAAWTGVTMLLSRAMFPAFAADADGIWLGKQAVRRSPERIGWEQVRQLTISSSPHGSVLQVLLGVDAPATSRLRQAASLALMAVPFGLRRTRPALLTVLPNPPRYRVPLARVTPAELAAALSAQAPATVPIQVLP